MSRGYQLSGLALCNKALSDTYQAAAELERLLSISDDTSVLLNPQ